MKNIVFRCSGVKVAQLARVLGLSNITNLRHHPSMVFVIFLLLPLNLLAFGGKKYDPTTLVYPSFLHTMGIRKATKMHLMIYTANRVKVKTPRAWQLFA